MIVVSSSPVSGGTDASNTTITLSAFALRNGATVMGGVKFEGAVTTVDRITDTAGNRYFWSTVSVANNSDINAFTYWAENCKAHPANVVTIVLAASRPFYRGFAMSALSDVGGTIKFQNFSASWISSGANPSTGPLKINGPAALVAVLSEYTTSTWTIPNDTGASAVTTNGSTGFYYRIPLGSGGWTSAVTSSDASTHKGVAAATFSEELAPSYWDALDFIAGGEANLVVADANSASTADNLALTQLHQLVMADAASATIADNLALTQVHALSMADAASASTTDNLALTQTHVLTLADAGSASIADNLVLTQVHQLAMADATSATTADNVVLNVAGTLIVSDAISASIADAIALTQQHNLTMADALSATLADALSLTQVHVLTVADALSASLADNLTLGGGATLIIADAIAGVLTDNIALTQTHQLVIDNALSAALADNLLLSVEYALIIANATSASTSENLVLSTQGTLGISDALSAAIVDAIALSQVHNLTIGNALSATTIDLIDWSTGQPRPRSVLLVPVHLRTLRAAVAKRKLTLQ